MSNRRSALLTARLFGLALGCLLVASLSAQAQFSSEVMGEASSLGPVLELEIVPADLETGDSFGSSSDIQGDVAVFSAHFSDEIAPEAGAVYVFRRGASGWQQEVKLTPADLAQDDNFGYSCSLDGDVLVISAPRHNAMGTQVGAVYVYRYDGNSWNQEQKLFPPTPLAFGRFGTDVSVSGDVIAVGRYRVVGGVLGEVHLFRYNAGIWAIEDTVTGADSVVGDLYAYSLDLDGDELVVGAYLDDTFGSMYFYRRNGSTWEFKQKVFAIDKQDGDLFSKGISMDGDVVVTGSNREDQLGTDAGAAYVFRFSGSEWVHEQKLLASDGRVMDRFGTHIAVNDGLIVVGSRLDDHVGGVDAGSAYIFRYDGSSWTERRKLIGSDSAAGDWAGHTVATDGRSVLMNSPLHSHPSTPTSGTSYLYSFPFREFAGVFPSGSQAIMATAPTGNPVILLTVAGHNQRLDTHDMGTPDQAPRDASGLTGRWPEHWGAEPPAGVHVYAVDTHGRIAGRWAGPQR